MTGHASTQELIVKLLRNLGSRKEVEQYLKQYSSVESRRFAVIKVGGGIIAEDLDALVSSLTFLSKVGLTPVVVHGAGPQLTEALKAAGVATTSEEDEPKRTSPRALEIVRRVFRTENLRLVDALEAMGTRARPITSGVFEAEVLDKKAYGLVGRVTKVHGEAIDSSLRAGHLPIIGSLGETPAGQILNLPTDETTRELAAFLEPFKIVILSRKGGFFDEYGDLIQGVNLEEDYAPFLTEAWVPRLMRVRLDEAKALLERLPRTSSVSITSPDQLAKELFTHKGSGTLIRRGERIVRHETIATVDRGRLSELLESSFGRKPVPEYYEMKPFFRIYLADSYRAGAILTLEEGVPYLDKFAVTAEAQGEGIGGSLWLRMARENPKLFWRARIDNEVNPWYFQRADGSYSSEKWTVFWYGIHDFDEIKVCVERALAMPATLKEHSIGQ
ncbi:acetylglutamate kinase [Chondromyces apiculatus]|uniref:Acetylglutamate kinase n=1 Tax=Chondromyces apiculatus DSM 436 TaxID=1192034 RepID=A0A017SVQ2_9BACT|nr:acetylglutamate kinase [Chondromyces apiculatus]EYF00690.1 Acetylglutamate kinase [Chondromyces apiculatus DSM 436]